MPNPGAILPLGLVLIDEPAAISVGTFLNGEVLMNISCRPGGNCGQVIVGLTPNMLMQLIGQLQAHSDICTRAIAEGKGGARFEVFN
jgi:hypothetical protein